MKKTLEDNIDIVITFAYPFVISLYLIIGAVCFLVTKDWKVYSMLTYLMYSSILSSLWAINSSKRHRFCRYHRGIIWVSIIVCVISFIDSFIFKMSQDQVKLVLNLMLNQIIVLISLAYLNFNGRFKKRKAKWACRHFRDACQIMQVGILHWHRRIGNRFRNWCSEASARCKCGL